MPDGTENPAELNGAGKFRKIAAHRLIVALGRCHREGGRRTRSTKLDGIVSFFKIGLWLLFEEGVERIIDRLVGEKKSIFLDYKMYDIGETVKRGVEAGAKKRHQVCDGPW